MQVRFLQGTPEGWDVERGDAAIVGNVEVSVQTESLDAKFIRIFIPKPDARADLFSKDWGIDPAKAFNPLPWLTCPRRGFAFGMAGKGNFEEPGTVWGSVIHA